jgi:hypothetical protein
LYPGSADVKSIFQEEMTGKYIDRVHEEELGEMLVMGKVQSYLSVKFANSSIVSATNGMRDELHNLVRDYLKNNVKLLELDYQPEV